MVEQSLSVTPKQLKEMLHALGLDWSNKPYRNYYCTYGEDPSWEDLVAKDLAIKHPFAKGLLPANGIYYHLTDAGKSIALENFTPTPEVDDD